MLVEDNDDSRAIYAVILRHNGYHVLEAEDGAMAVTMLNYVRPHLVLLDIALPRVSGWTVARWLRRGTATASIPIVALTAAVTPEDRARAAELGFVDFLAKPVEPRDVLKCVRRLIGGVNEIASDYRVFEVAPIDQMWTVTERARSVSSAHLTKNSAIEHGRELASRNPPSLLIIKKADGTIEAEFTYDAPPDSEPQAQGTSFTSTD